jgi:hypothetical protein
MVVASVPWWILPFVFGAPWIVAIAYYWPRARARDGYVPPSLAEMVRERLWR